MPISQVLKERVDICGAYHQFGRQSIVDTATATAEFIERDVIEVDDNTIEVQTNREVSTFLA